MLATESGDVPPSRINLLIDVQKKWPEKCNRLRKGEFSFPHQLTTSEKFPFCGCTPIWAFGKHNNDESNFPTGSLTLDSGSASRLEDDEPK
ncbi:hypothetical protein PanWU01x14_287860 [Parasponia andersonii]|uniref:Uncharacterized protein n=1 Tax=Parasponia andersonii TaxID=3476 RepID=A0A2P5AYH8_PARAD|nr:hypothetical protein PanWU01x14_287860 [Parasponia andersonii]